MMNQRQININKINTNKVQNSEYLLEALILLQNRHLGIKNRDHFLCKFAEKAKEIYFLLEKLDRADLLNKQNCNLVFRHIFNKTGTFSIIYLLHFNGLLNQKNFDLAFKNPDHIQQLYHALTLLNSAKLITQSNFQRLVTHISSINIINKELEQTSGLTQKKINHIFVVKNIKKTFLAGINDKNSDIHRLFTAKIHTTDLEHVQSNILKFV